jgi:type I restriction enzyme S subunit
MIKIKYAFDEISDKNHADEIPLVASQHMGVIPKSLYGLRTVEATKGLELFKRVKIGDFVISLRSFQGGLEYAYYQGIISPAYTVLRCRNSEYKQYYRLLFKSAIFIKLLTLCVTGIREGQNIDYSSLRQFSIPVPPRSEQDQIVRFLDYKTARIDKLISGYKRQIELLEERKQTVIDNAVTKGVRPDREMQTIMGNWMGSIPKDWKLLPSKRLFLESKTKKFSDDKPATASQKYGIILQEAYMRIENKRIVIATQGLENWKHVNKNDFVISLRSFQGGIERSEIIGCVTWHYIVLIPQRNVVPRYFKWLLKSKHYIKALQGTSEFIRDGQDLRYSNFTKIPLPLISIEEQNEIADYIETEISKIDNAIPVIEKQIILLQEYRTRLISDVVTGQIDVRDEIIPEQ